MGPRTKKKLIAHTLRKKIRWAKETLSLIVLIIYFFSTHSRSASYNKNACTVIKYFIYFQTTAVMEAGSFLTPEEATRMGGENPAAAVQKEMVPNPLLAASYKLPNVSPPLRSVVN